VVSIMKSLVLVACSRAVTKEQEISLAFFASDPYKDDRNGMV
jgi:hypothetical protein